MKRSLSIIMALLMLFSVTTLYNDYSYASDKPISVYIDGVKVDLAAPPVLQNNRTLVPLRGVFEKLGATVDWNKETNQVIVKTGDREVLLETNNNMVLTNGQAVILDVPSKLIKSRTFVPVRFVAETLGHKVLWNGKTRRIDILKNKGTKNNIETSKLPVIGSKEVFTGLLHYNNILNTYINETFGGFAMPTPEASNTVTGSADSMGGSAPSASSAAPTAPSSTPSESAVKSDGSHSNTNNQVEGVDEGDIIKTDGKYIYSLNQNRLFILDPAPTNPKIISTIDVKNDRGNILDVYVESNKLILIGTGSIRYGYPKDLIEPFKNILPNTYPTSTTFVLVYDLTNIGKPELVNDMDFEGYFVSSRLIEDKLYLVSNKGFNYWTNGPMYKSQPMYDTGIMYAENNEGTPIDEKDKANYEALLDYQFRPKYSNNITGAITVMDYNQIKYFPDYISPNFMLTIGIDLSNGAVDVNSYLGSAQTVYSSKDNMYLALAKYEYTPINTLVYSPNYTVSTSIYKFKLENGKISYAATGSVPGTLLNQFSLDEYNGNLRVATTVGETWNTENPSTNNIYVLDSNLKTIGKLTDLAKGEKIYSTRFSGDRIYMVTFKQVDPFFVIDASTPTNPKVVGYLKIPGFSTYMHILDKDHILGFGSDTIENGGSVRAGGLKISLFDVTDPANPIEKAKEVIGVAGTYSEIQNNHKALMIDLDKGLMAFPISVATKTPYSQTFNGAYVYNLTNSSFEFKGTLTHYSESTKSDVNQYYDYNYNINRLVYIGDYLYSLSNGKMLVTKLSDMKTCGEVNFPIKNYNYPIMVD